MSSNTITPGANPSVPIRIKQEIVEHLDLFHRIALEELVSRGRAEILP
ncbi:hypothetical protein [Methanospirillum sp.]